ncbi:hypothetical protein [uncultured Tateyamaria sp.]|uniref:hypothetical protein n=1 Tax=uncultured Tateyamaria sp. TaxID=455651 RepID=UPI0026125D79|nr:hypothetical protein [uncultured Tateyamaria sp.]
MEISDKSHFLVVRFDVENSLHHLGFVPEADIHSVSWDGTTRLSPVWEVTFDGDLPGATMDFELPDNSYVCFVGPVDPQRAIDAWKAELLENKPQGSLWATLGQYNLIVICEKKELESIREFCSAHDCRCEFWRVLDQSDVLDLVCDEIEYFIPDRLGRSLEDHELPPFSEVHLAPVVSSLDSSLKQAFLEFFSLRQITLQRSAPMFRALSDDAEEISVSVPSLSEILVGSELTDDAPSESGEGVDRPESRVIRALQYRDRILGINAALSRQVSQGYSGVAPLMQTECHFWPHSLLGAGVASLALRNLASFIIGCVNESEFGARYEARTAGSLQDLGLSEVDLSSEQLSTLASLSLSTENIEGYEPERWHIPAPITYYSGRDGFRYGTFSISAPLLCISGCNSKQWNLGTISHELSHRVVSHRLSNLLKGVRNSAKLANGKDIRTVLQAYDGSVQQAAETLLMTTLTLDEAFRVGAERFEKQKHDPKAFFANAIAHNKHELEERIVHMFDYFHFYNMEADEYVANIWQSWAIQPSIAEKFNSYIERTAVALALKHIEKENWATLTYEEFLAASDEHFFWHKTPFREKLHLELANGREKITKILRQNWSTIALFQLLFRSRDLAVSSQEEARETGRAQKLCLYDVSGMGFPAHTNPLQLIRWATTDKTPNSSRAAWLLSALAFRSRRQGG